MKKYLFGTALFLLGTMCAASCGSDPEEAPATGIKPTKQVSSLGTVTFRYDSYDRFEGFTTQGQSYSIENNGLNFSYFDFWGNKGMRQGLNDFKLQLNDRRLVSRFDFTVQFWNDEKGQEYRIYGSVIYGYDGNRHVNGIATLAKAEVITSEGTNRVGYKEGRMTINQTSAWKNGLLTDFQAKEETQWASSELQDNGSWAEQSWTEVTTTEGIVTYGSEQNSGGLFPATLCDLALCNMSIPMFAPIGLYGSAPTLLPTSCTVREQSTGNPDGPKSTEVTHTFRFGMNSDGTIASESVDEESPVQYQYDTTRSTADAQTAIAIAGLRRLVERVME